MSKHRILIRDGEETREVEAEIIYTDWDDEYDWVMAVALVEGKPYESTARFPSKDKRPEPFRPVKDEPLGYPFDEIFTVDGENRSQGR